LLLCAATAAAPAHADVYHLIDGDRISGKTRSKTARSYRVETAYGRLVIPKDKVAKIVFDDGREEVLVAARPSRVAATPSPPPPPVRLVLVITGDQFWHAWPEKEPPGDKTLRFVVSLDESQLAAYTDGKEDPEIKGALVNAMSFTSNDVSVAVSSGAAASKPQAQPGRITLQLSVPPEQAGERSLRVAYQVNEAAPAAPAWRDLAEGRVRVALQPGAANIVEIHQSRGQMEFSKKKMQNVETFRVEARAQ
jgi:hypothetical protein